MSQKKGLIKIRPLITIRLLIVLILSLYSYYSNGYGIDRYSFICIFILFFSNFVSLFIPSRQFEKRWLLKSIFVIDIVCISIVVSLNGQQIDLILIYSLVILSSSLYYRLHNIIFTLISVIVGFFVVYGFSTQFSMLETATLLRLPFFFIIAGFAGYLSKQSYVFKSKKEEAEMLYSALTNAINSGVVGVDRNLNILFCNKLVEEFLGKANEYLLGRNLEDIKEFKNIIKIFKTTLNTNQDQVRKEIIVKNNMGADVLLGCTTSLLKKETGEVVGAIAIFRDISDIIKNEEERQQLEKLALIGESTAGIAHEIKNPLAAITGLAEILEKHYSDNTEKVKEYTKRIIAEVDRIFGIIKDIRDVSKASTIASEKIKIKSFIENIIDNNQFYLMGKNIELESIVEVDNDYTFNGAKGLIEQLIVNLVKNAEDALEESGGGKIILRIYSKENNLYIIVKDNGSGIPDDVKRRIYDPFYTTKSQGTGLGLSICKRIVDFHNGDIDIISNDTGTEFIVLFPENTNSH